MNPLKMWQLAKNQWNGSTHTEVLKNETRLKLVNIFYETMSHGWHQWLSKVDHMHWVSTHMKLMSYKNVTIWSNLHQMDETILAVEFQITPFQLPWIGLNDINENVWMMKIKHT
jgi:hypothetical protein